MGAAPSVSPARGGPGYDSYAAGTVPLVAPEPNYAVLDALGHYNPFCLGPEVPALGEHETLLMSLKLAISCRAYRLKDIDSVVRSEQSKLVRRSAKDVKRLTGERASFDGSEPIKLLSLLRTVQETFDDGGVSEGLAARALYYLLGGEAQAFYTSRVATGLNPSGGAKPNAFTWPLVIHAIMQRYLTEDVLQEAYDSVTRARQGTDEDEDVFAVRMEASARNCSGVCGEHDLVSYYVQGLPETIRHTVREKVSSLEHSE